MSTKSGSSSSSIVKKASVVIPEDKSCDRCPYTKCFQNKTDVIEELMRNPTKPIFEVSFIKGNSITRIAYTHCFYKRGPEGDGCHHHKEDSVKNSRIRFDTLVESLEKGEPFQAKIDKEVRECTVSRITCDSKDGGNHKYFATRGTRGRKPDEKRLLNHTFDSSENPIYQIVVHQKETKEEKMLKCFAEIILSNPSLARKLLADSKEAVLQTLAEDDDAEDDAEEEPEEEQLVTKPAPKKALSALSVTELASMMDLTADAEDADAAEAEATPEEEAEATPEEDAEATPEEDGIEADGIEDDEGTAFAVDPSTLKVYLEDGTEIGLLKEVDKKYTNLEYNDTRYMIAVPREIKGKEYYICYHTNKTFDPSDKMKHVGTSKIDAEGNVTFTPLKSKSTSASKK
jgi:hypothetical protein